MTGPVSGNVATVLALYEAFGKGDAEAAAALATEDVDWEYAYPESPIPWLQPGRGREHVRQFFRSLAVNLDIARFNVNQVIPGDGVVVVLFDLDCAVRATGKRIIESDEPHIFWLDEEGMIRKFRHAADTLQQAKAVEP